MWKRDVSMARLEMMHSLHKCFAFKACGFGKALCLLYSYVDYWKCMYIHLTAFHFTAITTESSMLQQHLTEWFLCFFLYCLVLLFCCWPLLSSTIRHSPVRWFSGEVNILGSVVFKCIVELSEKRLNFGRLERDLILKAVAINAFNHAHTHNSQNFFLFSVFFLLHFSDWIALECVSIPTWCRNIIRFT